MLKAAISRLGVVGLIGLTGCEQASKPKPEAPRAPVEASAPQTPQRETRRVLATYDAPPYAYELSIEALTADEAKARAGEGGTDGAETPITIRLLKEGKAIDELSLRQGSCGLAALHPVEWVRGADRESQAWATSDEHCQVDFAARTVTLAAQDVGLLLTQALGFKYRYGRQLLLAARNDKLQTVWSFDEPVTGEDRTSATALPGHGDGAQDIAFIRVERERNDRAAKLTAERLRYEAGDQTVEVSRLPDVQTPLYVLAAGSYASASAAHGVTASCAASLDVLQGSAFPSVKVPPFFLGAVYARKTDAEAVVRELASCTSIPKADVLEYRSTKKPPE